MKKKQNVKAILFVCTVLTGGIIGLSRLPSASSNEQSSATTSAKGQGDLITLEFGEIDVSKLLSLIEEQTAIKIVFGNGVTGKIEKIKLVDVTPEQAMKEIAKAAGLKCFKIKAGGYVVENPILSKRTPPLEPFD